MGGIIIIISTVISTLLWGNPLNLFLLLSIGTLIFMGLIGFIDDYKKIMNKNAIVFGYTLVENENHVFDHHELLFKTKNDLKKLLIKTLIK